MIDKSYEESFGDYFRRLRRSKGYRTQKDLASKAGVSQTTLSRIEDGTQSPQPETLNKLAKTLGVSYLSLLKKAGYVDEYEKELMTPLDAEKDIAEINENSYLAKETPSSFTTEKESEIPIEELVSHQLTYKGHVLTEEQKKHLVKLLQAAADMLEK